jgi:hypothetical protein
LLGCRAAAHAQPPKVVDVTAFGAKGDGQADDTHAIQKAADAAAAQTVAWQPKGGAYLGSAPPVYFPAGHYKVSREVTFGGYGVVLSDAGAVVERVGEGRTFVFPGAYTVTVRGLRFLGGSRQLSFANANVDASTFHVEGCEFHLAKGFAVHTAGTTDGHLSAVLVVDRCRFILPRQVLHNACDSATVRDCWVFVGKSNFAPDSAAFVNRSGALQFDNMFGVPSFGDSKEHAKVRWVDNYDQFLATRSRFGGKYAGIPIVHHFGKGGKDYPWMGQTVTIEDSAICAGPAASPHAGVLTLRGGVPQLIRMVGNRYLIESPYIRAEGLDLDAYFKGARERYQVSIEANMDLAREPAIPRQLERFVERARPR